MRFTLPNVFVTGRPFFGLSIGKAAIRAIELDQNRRVIAYAQAALAIDTLGGGQVHQEAATKALQQLLAQKRFSTPYVAVCFPEAYAYSREITIPLVDTTQLHEAVSWQVKDLFPFPIADIYYDWKLLQSSEHNSTILVVCSPKAIIDAYATVLQSVGLRPVAFTSSASLLSALMPLKSDENALLVEVNERGSMATLVEHHVSFLTTTVSFDGTTPASEKAAQSIQLVSELINYYKGKKNIDPKRLRVFVTGELAQESLRAAFAGALPQPSALLTINGIPPAYHKAYAAAIGPLGRPEDPRTINLLPTNYQTLYDAEEFHQRIGWSLKTSSILMAVSLVVSLLVLVAVVIQKQTLTVQINQFNDQLTKAGFNRNEVRQIDTQARLITSLFSLKKTPESIFSKIGSTIPSGITLTHWSFDLGKQLLTISGVAQTREEVLTLRTLLESSDFFTTIQVPLSSLELPTNVAFTISATMKKQ